MRITIKCSRCKSESQLAVKELMTLLEAKETIIDIEEVLNRHRDHSEAMFVNITDTNTSVINGKTTGNYIYNAIRDKVYNYGRKRNAN